MTAKLLIKNEKRKFLSKEKALSIIKDYAQDMFGAYYEALERFNDEILQTKHEEARVKLEATLLNAKMRDSFIDTFPLHYRRAKYGHLIFRFDGVQMMIKKLDKRNKPSYIPTKLSNAIVTQQQMTLFEEDEAADAEPILFFGYTKQIDGSYAEPRIVYIVDDVIWVISTEDYMLKVPADNNRYKPIIVKPKKKLVSKRVTNN